MVVEREGELIERLEPIELVERLEAPEKPPPRLEPIELLERLPPENPPRLLPLLWPRWAKVGVTLSVTPRSTKVIHFVAFIICFIFGYLLFYFCQENVIKIVVCFISKTFDSFPFLLV